MEIIDFNAHPGYNFHKVNHGVDIDIPLFAKDLKACDITKVCGSYINVDVNCRPLNEYEKIIPELNRKAYEVKEMLGDFYVPGIHVHPDFKELSCCEIEKYAAKGVKLIGELVPYMMHFNDKCAEHNFIEIMECAAFYGMVVNVHPVSAAHMHKVSDEIPKNLTFVWAHLYGYGGYDDHIEMMKKHENIYFDISAHGTDKVGIISDAVNKVGSERLLFGTDYPGVGPASDFAAVMFENITDADRENIFYRNAKRLLEI